MCKSTVGGTFKNVYVYLCSLYIMPNQIHFSPPAIYMQLDSVSPIANRSIRSKPTHHPQLTWIKRCHHTQSTWIHPLHWFGWNPSLSTWMKPLPHPLSSGRSRILKRGGSVPIPRSRRQCIEVYSADSSTRITGKKIRLHFSLIRMGSCGTFMLYTESSRCS